MPRPAPSPSPARWWLAVLALGLAGNLAAVIAQAAALAATGALTLAAGAGLAVGVVILGWTAVVVAAARRAPEAALGRAAERVQQLPLAVVVTPVLVTVGVLVLAGGRPMLLVPTLVVAAAPVVLRVVTGRRR